MEGTVEKGSSGETWNRAELLVKCPIGGMQPPRVSSEEKVVDNIAEEKRASEQEGRGKNLSNYKWGSPDRWPAVQSRAGRGLLL